jgi:signal transduction histidine kinase
MRAVALRVLTMLRPLAEAKKLDLRWLAESSGAGFLPVRADREALALIMSNLVANAIKYTPEAGSVTVRMHPDQDDPSQVLFSVEDTGIGICEKDREHILSGYFRTEESQRVAKGFGVGLMLVKDLLGKHGSRLEFESVPGRGSRFYFRLHSWTADDPVRAAHSASSFMP